MATSLEEPRDAIWERQGAEKRSAVQRMFGEIAPTYDRLNGLISFNLHRRWRELAVGRLGLKSGDCVLDLCCGTGDFIPPLRRAVGERGFVFGVDFALPMLQVAQRKELPNLNLGDACALPVQSASVQGVTVGWGIRNVPDIDGAHREIYRVLKPGGRFVSLDMARPDNAVLRAVSEFTFRTLVPLFGSLFGKREAYTYLPKSTERFLSREQLADSMSRAGFHQVGWKNLMLGNICLHWGTKP